MVGLQVDHFIRAAYDFEQAQYQVLGGLKTIRDAFAHTIIYPYLGELIKLADVLRGIVRNAEAMNQAQPGEIIDLDLEAARLVRAPGAFSDRQLGALVELIQWALPQIEQAIDEGRTIYEFVDGHLHLEEVGLVPAYVEEGYLIVPDRQARQYHVLRYAVSVFTRADERYRSLKTTFIKSMPHAAVEPAPQHVKLELVAEHPSLPNPATYYCDAALDFPYEATVLPIAKRKLMRRLAQAA